MWGGGEKKPQSVFWESVSDMSIAVHVPRAFFSTVRHTPSTATESPAFNFQERGVWIVKRTKPSVLRTALICTVDWTMPVNMLLRLFVGCVLAARVTMLLELQTVFGVLFVF